MKSWPKRLSLRSEPYTWGYVRLIKRQIYFRTFYYKNTSIFNITINININMTQVHIYTFQNIPTFKGLMENEIILQPLVGPIQPLIGSLQPRKWPKKRWFLYLHLFINYPGDQAHFFYKIMIVHLAIFHPNFIEIGEWQLN